jgi:hypothetical protein
LPGIYLLLVLLFFAVFFEVADRHGWNPFEFVLYLVFPTGFLLELLPPSWGPQDDLSLDLLFMLAGLIQWIFIGYLIDKLLARHRKTKLKQEPS